MEQILLARQIIVNFYKRYESVFLFCFRLFAGIFVFRFINSIGFYREEFAPLFVPPFDFPYIVLSGLLFAVLPPTLANCLIMLELLIQISLSLEVSIFVFLLLVCILVFYARLQPKRSFLVLAVIIGFYFKMPYVVVIFAGLYLGLGSIIPIVIGTFIYQYIPLFSALVQTLKTPEKIDIMALPETFLSIYQTIYTAFTSTGNFGWIYTSFSFSMVILTVYAISRLSINYSKDIAILLGGTVNILCSILGVLMLKQTIGILELILYTFISVLIMEMIRFFDNVLDYKRVERVQFEDDENHYYVKIIPKVIIKENESLPMKTASLSSDTVERKARSAAPARDTGRKIPEK